MRLFTKEIDKQLFAQYSKGSDLENQMVVAKIFNPYGRGTWYLLNSDPEDPDYIWAIVDLFEVEMGSVSRSELESIKVPPFNLGFERDLYFEPVNAAELYKGLLEGKIYKKGGATDSGNAEMLRSNAKAISHHAKELQDTAKDKDVEAWVVAKSERAATDLSDVTHYLDGKEYANGGELGVDRHRIYFETFAEVINAIHDIAKDNGYKVVEIFPDLSYGGVSYGQTRRAKVELEWDGAERRGKSKKRDKNFLNVQIYRMDSGRYELNTYFAYSEGGYMKKGGSTDANITNEMRGEDNDEYGTFELFKRGGKVEVKILNRDEAFSKSKYDWLLGDFDKDGLANVDDKSPYDADVRDRIDSPSIEKGVTSILDLKNTMDKNMYSFVDDLKNISPDNSKIYARTKTPYSIIDKLIKKRLLNPKTGLTDLIGTTIVTNDKKELDGVKKVVESGKLGRVIELEDMYANPKQGYRAYHFLVEKNGMPIELQLKTKRQKALNELSHEPYKLGKLDSDKLIHITEVANQADNGNKEAIEEYNEFMKQPDLEKVFYKYADGGYMEGGGNVGGGGMNDNLEKLNSLIREKAKKSSGDPSNVFYIGSEKGETVKIGEYDGLKPYSAQAYSDGELKVSFGKDGTHFIFTNSITEIKEDRKSYEKYRGLIYLYIPLTEMHASEIIEKVFKIKMADGGYMAKGGIVVTSIKDIPKFNQRLEEGKITYRGLGMGKLANDFYKLAGTSGTRIKVDGKEYYITDEEFATFSRDANGKLRIRFDAPKRKFEDGGKVGAMTASERLKSVMKKRKK